VGKEIYRQIAACCPGKAKSWAASPASIRVESVKIGVCVLCSTLAALTGLLYLTRAGVGDPVTGEGAELQANADVSLGGTSLFGGQGGLIGTLGGVLLMGLTNNVLVILNVSSWRQEIDSGAGHRRRGRALRARTTVDEGAQTVFRRFSAFAKISQASNRAP
jgi:ABC-type xylose transport system permease subunit